jgi:tRNA(Ser,Leu) C12 N-acetylase TAN1
MLKIAIDTCCLNSKKQINCLNDLFELEKQKKLQIITTNALEKDHPSGKIQKKYLNEINRHEKKNESMVWGTSCWGNSDWTDSQIAIGVKEIMKKTTEKNNDFNDWHIIISVINNSCDYFITFNKKDFINNDKQDKFEDIIKVRLPNENTLKEIKNNL